MHWKIALAAGWLSLGAAYGTAAAQDFGAAFQGLSSDSDQPIQIESDRLEIRDTDKIAVYSGNVRVQQGITTLTTTELQVHYTGDAANGAPGSTVDRIDAGPPVVVKAEDRTATGDHAIFEMTRDMVTMTGNVVLTQGQNVVHGERLVVNLKSRQAHMEGGRVQTVITPRAAAKPKQ